MKELGTKMNGKETTSKESLRINGLISFIIRSEVGEIH